VTTRPSHRGRRRTWPVLGLLALAALAGPADAGERSDFVRRVESYTRHLASHPSRVVGTPGHDRALAWLQRQLADAAEFPNVRVFTQSFSVVVPRVRKPDAGSDDPLAALGAGLAIVENGGETAHPIYPLWPAGVRLNTTPSEGIAGRLLYIGEGEPGKPAAPDTAPRVLPARSLRGEIAVMEITGAHRWKDAYNAGARAILLLGSRHATGHSFRAHLLPIPLWVPRFYVPPGPLADRLRGDTILDGRLFCRAEWTTVTATNVYALVTPAEPTGRKAAAIGVPFDSTGVVPEQAPGADGAVDVAVALAALRHFAHHRPNRPLILAFTDAYGINQLGLRQMLLTLAADPKGDRLKDHREEDRKQAADYRERKDLAEELGLDLESLNRLHLRRYVPLRRYVKDEVAREVLAIEQTIQPMRVRFHALKRRHNELSGQLADPALSADRRRELESEIAEVHASQAELNEQIDAQKRARSSHNTAQKELLSDDPVTPDGPQLDRARDIWSRARHRAVRQLEEMSEVLRRHEERTALRLRLLDALGLEDPDARPLEFLLGLDLSDAGIAVGPCFRGRYLHINETQNADAFSRWLKQLDRDRGKQVWTGAARRALDLRPVTGKDSPDSYIVGQFPLFTAPAVSFALPAATWITLDAPRPRVDTPNDTADALDWDRLAPQVDATWGLLRELGADAAFAPTTKAHPKWNRILGTIVDQSPGEPVPRLPMHGYLATLVRGGAARGRASVWFGPVAGMRWQEYHLTGIDGRFRFDAVPGIRSWYARRFHVQAYQLGPDGRIRRAVDLQSEAAGVRLGVDAGAKKPKPLRARVFSCGELTVLGLFDQRFLVNLPAGSVLDARRGSAPRRMNYSQWGGMVACQLEPDTRWELVLRVGIVGNRMALLNMAEPDQGGKVQDAMRGFPLEEPLPRHPLLIAARDFYRLDKRRLEDYAAAGIVNKAIDALQERTHAELEAAEQALEADDGAALFKAASGAMANEVRAYRAVRDTANDVIRGSIFLLLMLVPFAYAVERLAFASPRVWQQIAGVLAIFAVMAAALWVYHPAFEISGQPMMIVMAFAIIFMSLMVISVVMSKFESGLNELRSGRAEASGARTSRLGLLLTALRLGIANMRRRKFRTVLTGMTVVLITFAMLCFMSTSSYRGQREFTVAPEAPFSGILIRQPSSRAMPWAALLYLRHIVGEGRAVAPRYWWNSQNNKEWRLHVRNPATGKVHSLVAALGLAPEEDALTGVGRACPQWDVFQRRAEQWADRRPDDETEPDPAGCYLPPGVAKELGVRPGDRVVIAGHDFVLIDLLDPAALQEQVRRLDGESILPLDYRKIDDEQRVQMTRTNMERLALELASGTTLEPDEHLPRVPADSLVILPGSHLAGMWGSTLRSISVEVAGEGAEARVAARELAADLAGRLAFPGRPRACSSP